MVAAAARAGVLPRRLPGRPHAGEPAQPARAEGRASRRGRAALPAPGGSPDRSPLPSPRQDKTSLKRSADAFLPRLLQSLRRLSRPFSGPAVLWSLYLVAATVCLLRALGRRPRGGAPPARHKGPRRGEPADRGGGEKNGQVRRKEAKEAEEKGEGRARGAADGHADGLRGTKKKK